MSDPNSANGNLVLPFWLRNPAKKFLEQIHEYRDANGRTRLARVRWRFADGTKAVTYRRPIASHKDYSHPKVSPGHDGRGWIPEAPADAGEYLYRLPELWEAFCADAPEIAWTEGESDADAVVRAVPGLPVTSHHGGAGKATQGQLDWFRGYEGMVLVCVDNDDPGAMCAIRRLDGLRALGVAAVLVGPAVGKDVRDHLEAGYAWAQMAPLNEDAIRVRAAECTPESMYRAGYDEDYKWLIRNIGTHGEGWRPILHSTGKPKGIERTTASEKLLGRGWRVDLGASR